MRILSWNILQGGGKRAVEIADVIVDTKADIVLLQEFRNGSGAPPILEALESMGLDQMHKADSAARKNTVMIASRHPITVSAFWDSKLDEELDSDLLLNAEVSCKSSDLHCDEFNLFVGHLPQKKKQMPYLDALYQLDLATLDNAMIIGDLNCGIPFEDSDTKSFDNTHVFQSILAKGWVDSWRSRNQDKKEFSWVSSRGNGYRYDHSLSSPSIDSRIQSIHYLHGPRESGLSDHSALLIDLQN